MSKHTLVRIGTAAAAMAAPLMTIAAAGGGTAGASAGPALENSRQAAAAPCADKSSAAQTPAKSLRPSVVKHLVGGGSKYVYVVGDHQITFPILPAGFDAAKATSAELTQYGLPPEPANPSQQAEWRAMVDTLRPQKAPQLQVRETLAATATAVSATAVATGASGQVENGITTSTTNIWTGYVSSLPGQTTHYVAVRGDWRQPSIGSSTCQNAVHVDWVGLGGYNLSQLLQDGTDQNNNAWFEYLGPGATGIATDYQFQASNLSISPGDLIEAQTLYQQTTHDAVFDVTDITKGQIADAVITNMSPYYNGSTAEFVDERSSICQNNANCVPSPLANYGSTKWTYAAAASMADVNKGNQMGYPLDQLGGVSAINMTDSAGNTIATAGPEGQNGAAFYTYWDRCS